MNDASETCPPLHGLKIVEFGQFLAVPAAAQALRDLGASVVKIEPKNGDAARRVGWDKDDFGPMFTPYNRGKRSVCLDLNVESDRQAAFALCQEADVVLANARPGAMRRAGLGPAQLREARPDLIVASVTGFAPNSAYGHRLGFDIAAQAEGGLMSINGEREGPPMRIGYTVIDVLAGHTLTQAVLAALVRRGFQRLGATIEVSLLDVAVGSVAYPWAEYGLTSKMPYRAGNGQPATAPGADLIIARDGAVVVTAYLDAHFQRLTQAVGRPDMAADPRFATNAARVVNRVAMMAELSAAVSDWTSSEVCSKLNEAGVVAGAVRDFNQVRQAPNGLSSDLFVHIQTGPNAYDIPGRAFAMDRLDAAPTGIAAAGEHTEELHAHLKGQDSPLWSPYG